MTSDSTTRMLLPAASETNAPTFGWPGWNIVVPVFGALLATGFGVLGYDLIQQGLLTVLTAFVLVKALHRASSLQFGIGGAVLLTAVFACVLLAVISAGSLSGNHLYFVFVSGLAITCWQDPRLNQKMLMRITNAYYLVFLGLSLGVYTGAIDLARDLNIFDSSQRISGFDFMTFVGFYGSTAHIDSLSLLVALLNLMYSRGAVRFLFVAIGLAASVATLRYTPFASLGIALTGLVLIEPVRSVRVARRVLIGCIVLAIFLSAPLAMIVTGLTQDSVVERIVSRGTSGRLRIWRAMNEVYTDLPLVQQAFGVGSTEQIYEVGGWPRRHPLSGENVPLITANPHNSFLNIAYTIGVVPFIVLLLIVIIGVTRLHMRGPLLITLYLLAIGITNVELFTFMFPIFAIWLIWFVSSTNSSTKMKRMRPNSLSTDGSIGG